jgi:hypothetical protein
MAFALTRKHDRRMLPIVLGGALLTFGLLFGLGILIGHLILGIPFAVLAALLVAMNLFSRRAQNVMYSQAEGQPGSSYGVVTSMRGDWRVGDQPAAVTRSQDFIFRVIGRPGVVIIGEGNANRVGQLIAQEKKRVARVVSDVPIYEVVIGNDEGQIPLRRLQGHLMKLPRNLKPAHIAAVEARLRALSTAGLPIPKGPLPKNLRVPRRMR